MDDETDASLHRAGRARTSLVVQAAVQQDSNPDSDHE